VNHSLGVGDLTQPFDCEESAVPLSYRRLQHRASASYRPSEVLSLKGFAKIRFYQRLQVSFLLTQGIHPWTIATENICVTNQREPNPGRDRFRQRGALGHLSFGSPKQVWPIWPFVWKAWKYALLCVVPPQKSIFCCADFGSTFALDVQQELKPFLHSSK